MLVTSGKIRGYISIVDNKKKNSSVIVKNIKDFLFYIIVYTLPINASMEVNKDKEKTPIKLFNNESEIYELIKHLSQKALFLLYVKLYTRFLLDSKTNNINYSDYNITINKSTKKESISLYDIKKKLISGKKYLDDNLSVMIQSFEVVDVTEKEIKDHVDIAKDEFEKNKRYITFEDIKNLCVQNKTIIWTIDDKYLNENILLFDGGIEFKSLESKNKTKYPGQKIRSNFEIIVSDKSKDDSEKDTGNADNDSSKDNKNDHGQSKENSSNESMDNNSSKEKKNDPENPKEDSAKDSGHVDINSTKEKKNDLGKFIDDTANNSGHVEDNSSNEKKNNPGKPEVNSKKNSGHVEDNSSKEKKYESEKSKEKNPKDSGHVEDNSSKEKKIMPGKPKEDSEKDSLHADNNLSKEKVNVSGHELKDTSRNANDSRSKENITAVEKIDENKHQMQISGDIDKISDCGMDISSNESKSDDAIGLSNPFRICYLNSTLQLLIGSKLFVDFVNCLNEEKAFSNEIFKYASKKIFDEKKNTATLSKMKVTSIIKNFVQNYSTKNIKGLNDNVKTLLDFFKKNVSVTGDTLEMFDKILMNMTEETALHSTNKSYSPLNDLSDKSINYQFEVWRMCSLKGVISVIDELFGIYKYTKLTCTKCNSAHYNFELFYNRQYNHCEKDKYKETIIQCDGLSKHCSVCNAQVNFTGEEDIFKTGYYLFLIMDNWEEKSFVTFLKVPYFGREKIYKISQVLLYNTYHYYVLRITHEEGKIYVFELNDNVVTKLFFHDVFQLLKDDSVVLKEEYKNRLQTQFENDEKIAKELNENKKKKRKKKSQKEKTKIPPFEIRAVMYELYDENKKYEIVDVIKQIDDITFPPDINEKIYETGINDNDKQNGDNDIVMIERDDEKIPSIVENIPCDNGKNSLRDQNIPQESKTVVVPQVKNKNLEIGKTDWINYSVKKLNCKDNENNVNKRKRSIVITEREIMEEMNKKKIEMRKQRNNEIIMERRKKNIENQGQRDEKTHQISKKLNMKEKEKESEKKKTTNIHIKTEGKKDSRDIVKGSEQKEKDSRKSNSQKSGDSNKGKKDSREQKEKDSHRQKGAKVVGDSKAKKEKKSTIFTKGNVRKLSRKNVKISEPKRKVSTQTNTQKAEVSKEKEVKKIRIKKEYKEEDEGNKLKGDYEKCDNLSDAQVFFEQKKKFEGKMVYNQEIVDLKKYIEKLPKIKTGKHNTDERDKYWFMPWYLEHYANPLKKTNDKKIALEEGSDWRMLPVLCVICLTKITYRQYFSHLCNFHPNCYVPEVLRLLGDNWKKQVLTVLHSYVKDKLTPFLNDIVKINNQFSLFYRIAKADETGILTANGLDEFKKFKEKELVFNEPTKELIESAFKLKKKGNIARYGNDKNDEEKEEKKKRPLRKAKPMERLNEKHVENEGNEESNDEDIKTKKINK